MLLSTDASAPSSRPLNSDSESNRPWSSGAGPDAALAFERAVEPYIPDMLRAARSILGSEDLAWDAVQETLLRIWCHGWLPETPVRVLRHLVVRSSLHQLRCQRRRGHHEAHAHAAHVEGEPCCEDDPLLMLEQAELARSLRESVRGLTAEYRAALELFAFEGESYEEIASRLDVPVGTVRSRLNRGRSLLRERLSESIEVA